MGSSTSHGADAEVVVIGAGGAHSVMRESMDEVATPNGFVLLPTPADAAGLAALDAFLDSYLVPA